MQRYDVINALIEAYGYNTYLELGTQGDRCLKEVRCDYKVGVDPEPVLHEEENSDEFYKMTSDDFFEQNQMSFDIIFIDGLHEDYQVRRDIFNSLKCITDGGAIVVHDCNPQEEINQQYPMPHVKSWNGTVWRAWMAYRRRKDVQMYVVDVDEGCGVIMRGTQEPIKPRPLSFDNFRANRVKWLNLITEEEFYGKIGKGV